jgi:D-arabinose 1-dehydrogenase-like Zn-dependent alcohol dehydrogenase
MSTPAKGYAVHAEKQPLAPFALKRRDPHPNDVRIEIFYCGVCHSDLHTARGDWNGLIGMRRHLAGSLIGGIAETQELLDFCAKHNVIAEIEKIPMQEIEKAYERMLKSEVKYRFVIDMASLKQST